MPYNPQAYFDPGLISRIGDSAAGSIVNIGAQLGQIKKQDKAAKAFYDAFEPESDAATGALKAHPIGLTRDAWNSLSSQDRIAKVQGFIETEAVKTARARESREQADAALRDRIANFNMARDHGQLVLEAARANRASRQDALQDRALAAVPRFTQDLAAPGAAPQSANERLMRAFSENPDVFNLPANSLGGNLLERFLANERTAADTFFRPGETNFALPNIPGMLRVPTGPNTSVILADPSKAGQAVAITGPDGQQVGLGLPTRSGVTPLATGSVKENDRYNRLTRQLTGLIAAQGKAYRDETRAEYQKQIEAVEAELNGLETGGGASATPGGASAPAGGVPKVGEVRKGYRFKGGDPANKASWEKI